MIPTYLDLNHIIRDGQVAYKGLPPIHICDFWSREASRAFYDDGSEFQMGKIEMVTNTGTYLDAPFHRFADGADIAALDLRQLADLPAVVFRQPHTNDLATDAAFLQHYWQTVLKSQDLTQHAVLIQTDWSAHWETPLYYENHPFLTPDAADWLIEKKVTLVGIDAHNIDDTRVRRRPIHTRLLGAGVLIVEHLTGLSGLPDAGFWFTAVPPRLEGVGTFAVRAFGRW